MEKVLTRNIEPGKAPTDMTSYEANGGYQGLHKALTSMSSLEYESSSSSS